MSSREEQFGMLAAAADQSLLQVVLKAASLKLLLVQENIENWGTYWEGLKQCKGHPEQRDSGVLPRVV